MPTDGKADPRMNCIWTRIRGSKPFMERLDTTTTRLKLLYNCLIRLFDFANKTPSSPPHAVNLTDQLQP